MVYVLDALARTVDLIELHAAYYAAHTLHTLRHSGI